MLELVGKASRDLQIVASRGPVAACLEQGRQLLEEVLIDFIKAIFCGAVNVNHRYGRFLIWINDGDNDFALGIDVAGDMTGVFLHVGHQLGLAQCSSISTNPTPNAYALAGNLGKLVAVKISIESCLAVKWP
jgi:hypothetical protein